MHPKNKVAVSKKYKFIIVEDNPIQQKILASYLAKIPTIEEVGIFSSSIDTMVVLSEQEIDILFLDVQLPELDGLSFLRTLRELPSVVLVSAHDNYAIEAFELGVVDFLLKPFSFERVAKAVERALLQEKKPLSIKNETVFMKVGREWMKFVIDEIDYFEAYGGFTKVYVNGKATTLSEPISEIEEKMPSKAFVRVHRSFLVNRHKIQSINAKHVIVGEAAIPLGASFRENIESFI